MKKIREFIGFIIIASVITVALTGCSQSNNDFAGDSSYPVVNLNATIGSDLMENHLTRAYSANMLSNNVVADEWLGGSIIVDGREYRAREVWESLIDGSGSSDFNVSDIENAVSMKHLQLDDRYLLWWFDEQGREVGIGDVARICDGNSLAIDNANDDMFSPLASSNFFAVRFLPEQVYNPDNLFPFRAVSLESLKSMYRDLNEQFDYTLMIPFGLGYMGHFNKDINFVEMLPDANANDFINRRMYNADGSIGFITPIRAIGLGRTLYQGFDSGISEGRNLVEADFYKNSPEQAISVVLGYAYKEHHNVGDTFQLQMNWQTVNFTVVGFFQQGVGATDSGIGFGEGAFDYTIVMPLFSIGYEPTDGDNFIFQTFHYNYLVSGLILINEPTAEINADTHARYKSAVLDMADRNGLSNAFYLNSTPASLELLGIAEPTADGVQWLEYEGIIYEINTTYDTLGNRVAVVSSQEGIVTVVNDGMYLHVTEQDSLSQVIREYKLCLESHGG